jgi:hypothetical protein
LIFSTIVSFINVTSAYSGKENSNKMNAAFAWEQGKTKHEQLNIELLF